ncbi:RNA polymerase primary sigma factor [Variovorax paradoxus]|uniref:sigma-70 family RNA polymerase sigma factor n=1 Tax=Variovorax paradoxus TaxID=34073 RepID=UPI00278AC130|nr:sigma-70 family RNA polymerase sigma factor [Variovorax paradoxus]MDP9967516.1 RNA polymerase primary sigma factor [Variovorax paradoxus]
MTKRDSSVGFVASIGEKPLSSFFRMAVVAGVESAVKLHIARGDNINARDLKGQTPLMIAARRDKTAICRLLVDAAADISLVDANGQDALSIAVAAGANGVAAFLSALAPPAVNEATTQVEGRGTGEVRTESIDAGGRVGETNTASLRTGTFADEEISRLIIKEQLPAPVEAPAIGQGRGPAGDTGSIASWDDEEGGSVPLDLASWIPDDARPPPADYVDLAKSAARTQAAINDFTPIDSSADWAVVDIFLPEQSTSPLRTDDERRVSLRRLLLRALREGSVPEHLVEDFAVGDDREPQPEIDLALRMTLNDIGAETDERFECLLPDEDFRVVIDERESPEEEDAVREAIDYFEDRASDRNAPIRLYGKQLSRQTLLTAQEEIALAQALEASVEEAIDALAAWPGGIERLLDAAESAARGLTRLESIAVLAFEKEEEDMANGNEAIAASFGANDEPDDLEDPGLGSAAAPFFARTKEVQKLPRSGSTDDEAWPAMRLALKEMGLRKSFLLSLADWARRDQHPSAALFVQATERHQCAREKMSLANIKLVRSIAAKYLFFSGMPIDDLIQEGNLGLLKAVEKFDWRKGFRFSTYATWWIRQAISRSIGNDSRLVRIPVHVHEHVMKLEKAVTAFESKNLRTPTAGELSAMLGLPSKKVATILRSAQPIVSLETPGIEEVFAADFKAEAAAQDPVETAEAGELRHLMRGLVADLGRKPERIIRARFGFDNTPPMTLEELGASMGVTRERIRQIEAKALKKLNRGIRAGAVRHWIIGESHELLAGEERAEGIAVQVLEPAFEIPELVGDEERAAVEPEVSIEMPSKAYTQAHAKLLREAEAAGVVVEDRRADGAGHLEFQIREPEDGRNRTLIRKLVLMGFQQTPTGYRK